MGWMLWVLTRRRPGGVLLVTVAFTDVEMLLLECDANVSGSKALENAISGGIYGDGSLKTVQQAADSESYEGETAHAQCPALR